jgi:hypothetical protein
VATWRSRRPRSGEPSRACRKGGRSKRVSGSLRARRSGESRLLRRADRAAVGPRRLVAVGVCGTHTSMTRFGARAAPRGRRAVRQGVPRNRGKNTTPIASMNLEGGIDEAMVVQGATTDAAVFEAYGDAWRAPWRLRSRRGRDRAPPGQPRGAQDPEDTTRARRSERRAEVRFLPATRRT